MAQDNQSQPCRRPDSPRPVSLLTGGPFHINPRRHHRRGTSPTAASVTQDRPFLPPRRHTLSEVVRYVDKQCAYLDGLTQENGGEDAAQGGWPRSSLVIPAEPTMVDHSAMMQTSDQEAVKADPGQKRGSTSTCSDFSFPSTPRRNSLESYSHHVTEYEVELNQPHGELLMVVAATKFTAEEFDASSAPGKHSIYKTNTVPSVPPEEPMFGKPECWSGWSGWCWDDWGGLREGGNDAAGR